VPAMHCTVFVDDLDERFASISARGIKPAAHETYANGVRKFVYRDPDGNLSTHADYPFMPLTLTYAVE
jgi:hypothetical protein